MGNDYNTQDGRPRIPVRGRMLVSTDSTTIEYLDESCRQCYPLPSPINTNWRFTGYGDDQSYKLARQFYTFIIEADTGFLLYEVGSSFQFVTVGEFERFRYELLTESSQATPVYRAFTPPPTVVSYVPSPTESASHGHPQYQVLTFSDGATITVANTNGAVIAPLQADAVAFNGDPKGVLGLTRPQVNAVLTQCYPGFGL